jgi:hypothetical protein
MKNKFITCATGALLLWTVTGITNAQTLSGIAKGEQQTTGEYYIPVPEQLTPLNCPGFFFRNEINPKAVRNFLKEYKDVTTARWLKENNRFAVHFTHFGSATIVYYDKNGNFQSRVSIYSETQLPRDVRHLVKSKYYDQNITRVLNVKQYNRNIWVISLEDANEFIMARVEDMELKETQRIQKSK